MKKYIMIVALIGLVVSPLNAALIDLGWTGGQPADVQSELNRLNGQIGIYNQANDPDLSLASFPVWQATKTEIDGDLTSITLDLLGFNGYLLFKYGPVDRFFYASGLDSYTFRSDVYNFNNFSADNFALPPAAGLSHYTTFAVPVPETSTWVTSLALFLPFALSTMRRFKPSV